MENIKQEEKKELDRHFKEDFQYDEFYAVEPKIFELVEDGDIENLQKLLNKIGGF